MQSFTRAPSNTERAVLIGLAVAYGAITLSVLPWATQEGPRIPRVIAVCNGGLALADLCTAFLLGREFRRLGKTSFLVLACAYLFSAGMALLHAAVFPGAFFAAPLYGEPQTVIWQYLFWRLGTAVLLLAGVVLASRPAIRLEPAALRLREGLAYAATLAGGAVLAALAARVDVPMIVGTKFTIGNFVAIYLYLGLLALALALIRRGRAFGDVLYIWLAVFLTALIAEQLLGTLSGAQYTIGWHAAKASSTLSSCLLLVFWLAHVRGEEGGERLGPWAAYGAALGAMAAAVALRWFLTPWIGPRYPYATLFGAVATAVWIGGWRPALLAAVLGAFAANYLFAWPASGFAESPGEVFGGAMYLLSAVVIIVLGEAMRRASERSRRSELELRERARELQLADANKSQFLAVLSHELRNPLAPLLHGLELLRLRPESLAQTRAMMERQVKHLRRLIDDLLDVSRIDRGKLDLRRDRVAVEAVVRAAIDAAKPNIEARSHELVVRYAAEPLYVDGDEVRLSQVVSNLLNNAAKFTPSGGRIEVAMRAEAGEALISVRDDGAGFAPEQAERIFEMFVQLDSSRTQAAGGLGLGLSVGRSLARMHGGRLEAASEGPGRGALFTLRLPLAPAAAQAALAAAGARPARHGRVLVVDDNRDAADTLAELLRLHGFEARACYDGAQALALAQEFRPRAALVDLNMPGLSGTELARRLRAEAWARDLRLVALTGMGQAADVEATRLAGFDAHLPKPAAVEDVLRAAGGDEAATVLPLASRPG